MFAKTECNWTGQRKGIKDNIFGIDGNKRIDRYLQILHRKGSPLRKKIKNSNLKLLGPKHRLEIKTILLERGIQTTSGLIEILAAACLKVWDGLASKLCIRLGG